MSAPIRYLVAPSRLESAEWNPSKVAGDIYRCYSADTIVAGNKVRAPFHWRGCLWITTSLSSFHRACTAEAYRLIAKAVFQAKPTTYWEKTQSPEDAKAAREDPMGFYHGMTVTQGRESYVLAGPPATFAALTLQARKDHHARRMSEGSVPQPLCDHCPCCTGLGGR